MISITRKEFNQLASYIQHVYGIHLKEEKTALLIGRLAQLVKKKGLNDFGAYYDYLIADRSGEALVELINKISTNHTFFMREPEHFYYLRDHILPSLEKVTEDKDIRIWCAGCSTGQESYTIAMILSDYFQTKGGGWDYRLLATDISTQALDQAKAGKYTPEQIAPLPKQWRKRYFYETKNGSFQIVERLRSQVIYRIFNLMEPRFPFKKKFQVIYCRNVMIYFDVKTREALVRKFWEMTANGGYLIMSQSESIPREKTRYKYILPGIYKKE